jgi:hypothetical protein
LAVRADPLGDPRDQDGLDDETFRRLLGDEIERGLEQRNGYGVETRGRKNGRAA